MDSWQATGTDGLPNLKQVAADRLAAHRQRRQTVAAQEAEFETRTRQHRESLHGARRDAQRRGASVVRDAVMARYERRESYREFLAGEAERAIAQAQAEADVATRNAKAVTEAQMALLDELAELNRPDPGPRETAIAQKKDEARGELAHALADIVLGARELIDEPPRLTVMEAPQPDPSAGAAHRLPPEFATREVSAAGLTVRLFEDMPPASTRAFETRSGRGRQMMDTFSRTVFDEEAAETLTALEEEIDFRRAPEFPERLALATEAIPGNLIEFPRELVAPRRARPRLAEGPLGEPEEPQLRIFEVDAEQSSPEPQSLEINQAPEWQTLQLGGFEEVSAASSSTASDAQTHLALPLYSAPIERRLMAAAVDVCTVSLAWLAAAACVGELAGQGLRALSPSLAAVTGCAAFAFFFVLYQVLFFTFAEGTPGMRYARIALCTFGESKPSRRAMRQRVLSTLLAACPLGLGLAWALLDNDKLGWHDRMSRMYQRAY